MTGRAPRDVVERVENLRKLIEEYRYKYHVLDESTMSEAAADVLKRELADLEEEWPELVTVDSPTQKVAGRASEKFAKVKHAVPMMSLSDVFDEGELLAWRDRIAKLVSEEEYDGYLCDIKMDGLACALIYEGGKLVRAVTRGDGKIGEDVTENVMEIENVPRELKGKGVDRLEVRGEIVISKMDFEELNVKQRELEEKEFANPRNLAAGTIRQLDAGVVKGRKLRFLAYDEFVWDEVEAKSVDSRVGALEEMGFETSGKRKVLKSIEEVVEYVKELEGVRDGLAFGTDGAVVKVNNREVFKKLGVVGKAPRGAVAFKFAAEETATVVKDIVISIGRTGAATPVAVFDPVKLAGTTVKHASLHNADEIARLDVRVGDTVVIYKAGDIIPQVERVLVELRPAGAEEFSYETALSEQYPELEFERADGDVVYRVKGASGDLILKKSLEYYASRGAMNIEGLGEKNVVALVEAGLVKDIADLYLLKVEDVAALERFGEVSARNLVEAVQARRQPELGKFIAALGIRHVGAQTAEDLARVFGSFEKLAEAGLSDLEGVDGVGKVVAESILAWFADEDNAKLVDKLLSEAGVKPVYEDRSSGKLAGKSFVVTGTLESMGRDEAAEKIRGLGGVFQKSVVKDTDYLVAGGGVGASKRAKAEKYGTQVISEAEFLEMIRV
ncbi:NAD-dependent DNA ligase LigA [Candidatus Saccharibacteria bacterium]|nr:NAD-dependent DNA ligase LigA [Candidatus Saccharibacteria bacterium]